MPNAGKIIRVNDNISSWQYFTPVWLNFTKGIGTTGGKWRQMGEHTIEWRAFFTFGSGSAVSGQLGITIPNGYTGFNDYQILSLMGFDSSTGIGYAGYAQLVGGGGTTFPNFYGPNSIAWGTAVPFTWAASDYCIVHGITEITT